MSKSRLELPGQLIAVHDPDPARRGFEVRREEDEVTPAQAGSGGDEEGCRCARWDFAGIIMHWLQTNEAR
jgi:hypothetical protein